MKRFATLLLAPTLALAATTVTDVPGTHDLYSGSKKLGAYSTHALCVNAAVARGVTAKYTCRNSSDVTVTFTPPPQPPAETQTVPCPPPSTATWTQVRTYTTAPPPTYWVPGPWTPATPPAGACPPPAPTHPGQPVDPTTFMAPYGGSTQVVFGAPQTPMPSVDGSGDFRTLCLPTHMSFDDPIVFPGQPGASHGHVFFGNSLTDASSTSASLLATGGSSCRGGIMNRTAYWAPIMLDGTTAIKPQSMAVYYKTGYNAIPHNLFVPPPPGLKFIAGDAKNMVPLDVTQGQGHYSYRCDNNSAYFASIPAAAASTDPQCGAGHTLWMQVYFPQCWDGVNLDSPDHKSHMAYPGWFPGQANPGCPLDHPVPIPEITLQVLYTIPAGGFAMWKLASDMDGAVAGVSAHADYMFAWDTNFSNVWINCLTKNLDCQAHMLSDGRTMGEFDGN